MSTTRSLFRQLHLVNSTSYLKDFKKDTPSKTLIFKSMPCEIKAAHIRNSTIDGMENNDIAEVAYRFLQSRRGENNTFYEACFWSLYTIMLYSLIQSNPACYIFLIPNIARIPPNISNTLSYHQTKNACEEWLAKRLSIEHVQEIKSLKYDQKGLNKLTHFLTQNQIKTDNIEDKKCDAQRPFSYCFNMDK